MQYNIMVIMHGFIHRLMEVFRYGRRKNESIYKLQKWESGIIEDVVDFLRHDDHVIFKRKRNVSEKLFVQIEIKKILIEYYEEHVKPTEKAHDRLPLSFLLYFNSSLLNCPI